MTQRIILCVLIILILVTGYNTYRLESTRLAYVDSAKLLTKYKGMNEAQQSYQKKVVAWKSNVDTLSVDVQNAIRQYERGVAAMSIKQQELAKQIIRTKQKRLADYQETIRQSAQQEDVKSTQAVLKQVNAFLDTYGKKHHYALILVANQTGNIAYAQEGLDITEDVVTELNKQYISINR